MAGEPSEIEGPAGAAETPRRSAGGLLSMLAERIPARLGASTVYGAPVERDGVTVVPVAVARFGLGAGRGSDPSKAQEGEGGGGGGMISPAGYIELKDGRSRFVPIVDPARMLALVCAAVLGGLVLIRPLIGRREGTMHEGPRVWSPAPRVRSKTVVNIAGEGLPSRRPRRSSRRGRTAGARRSPRPVWRHIQGRLRRN